MCKKHFLILLSYIVLYSSVTAQQINVADSLEWDGLTEKFINAFKKERLDSAQFYAELAVQKAKQVFGTVHPSYAASLSNQAFLFQKMAKYAEAESIYLKVISINKTALGENHADVAVSLMNLGELYVSLGRYTDAEPLFRKSVKILALESEDDTFYATSLNNLAVLYIFMGKYAAAEPYFQKAAQIRKSVVGENHPDYATSLNNLASLYSKMGNYPAALGYNKEVAKIFKAANGEEHTTYLTSLSNLALTYQDMGDYVAAEPLFKKVLESRRKKLGENHPTYALTLNNLAFLYSRMGNYAAADSMYQLALQIRKKVLGENHPDYATSLSNLAFVAERTGDFSKAESYHTKALAIRKAVFGDNHAQYILSLNNLVACYYAFNQAKQWDSLIAYVMERENTNEQLLLKNFSESEKETYLITNGNSKDLFLSMLYQFKTTNVNPFYQSTTAKQAWLLNGKKQLIEFASQSKDTAVKSLLLRWQNANKQYSKAIQLTADKKKANNINEDSLKLVCQQLEKQLILALPTLQSIITNTGFTGKEVAAKLKTASAVVHWISFKYKSPQKWTDSVLYAAYIISPKDTAPKFVTVFEEKQLQRLLEGYHGMSGRGATVLNAQKNNKINKDTALYNLIWKPLLSYLGNASIIYNLPSGLLHKVSFAALTDKNNKQLIDNYEIHQLSNISELIHPVKIDNAAKKVTLFGAADFDASDSTTTNTASAIKRNSTTANGVQFAYLPGTNTEIQMVVANANKTGWITSVFTQSNATENQFKNIGKTEVPKILHIATHGYYFPPPKSKQTDNAFDDKNAPKDFPLLRSGIVLSGANIFWGKDTLLENKEDGIVNAQEISNLNLLKTDLVVLSACQTALGDINGSEGVYGLQRAFKMAGVKKLLMSLWEVPDAETAELMQLFYSNLFKGASYYKAFRDAQLVLKAKYKDPNKWAGFVLVGE